MWTLPIFTKNASTESAASSNGHGLIELRGVQKSYKTAVGDYPALKGIDLEINAGEFVSVIGKSGSGKTTLINMITGIDRPSSGEVWVHGTPVHTLRESQMARWRGKNLGIVFQFFQLLPIISVVENIMLPMDFCNSYPLRERQARAMHLLDLVGLADHALKLPTALSGGQQQRVAIARSLVNDPSILLADEPTGNLDTASSTDVMSIFDKLHKDGRTIVMVTHSDEIAQHASRIIRMRDGKIVSDERRAA